MSIKHIILYDNVKYYRGNYWKQQTLKKKMYIVSLIRILFSKSERFKFGFRMKKKINKKVIKREYYTHIQQSST